MDYIRDLGQAIRAAVAANAQANRTGPAVGRIVGDRILVNGRYYRATWGGDFEARDGQNADCILGDGVCVVVSVR